MSASPSGSEGPGWSLDSFVAGQDLDPYICSICHNVLREPEAVGCPTDHLFCDGCISSHPSRSTSCPTCAHPIKPPAKPATFVKRLIDKLRVKCINPGCSWTGPLANRVEHSDQLCDRALLRCSNVTYGCKWRGKPPQLQSHEEECPFTLVPCERPLCKNNIFRRDIEKHAEHCEEYQCSYRTEDGCPFKGRKSAWEAHEEYCSVLHAKIARMAELEVVVAAVDKGYGELAAFLRISDPATRGIAWMRSKFEADPTSEIEQVKLWTMYRVDFEGFKQTHPLLAAADVVKLTISAFPEAMPGATDPPTRKFIVKGMRIRNASPAAAVTTPMTPTSPGSTTAAAATTPAPAPSAATAATSTAAATSAAPTSAPAAVVIPVEAATPSNGATPAGTPRKKADTTDESTPAPLAATTGNKKRGADVEITGESTRSGKRVSVGGANGKRA